MSVDAALARVLERLSDGQVDALAARCEEAAVVGPGAGWSDAVVGASPAARAAVSQLAEAWSVRPGLTGAGVALALRTGLRARCEAASRRSRAVWTGPGATGEQRLTASVLHELIAGARERVLLVSFAAYALAGVAADLTDAVARGCEVDVVFETEHDSAGAYQGPHAAPFGDVVGIRRWRWPAERRDHPGALLHAKLLVTDRRRALVGSANLTHRALHTNLEAGVLVEDPDVAEALDGHVRSLMTGGMLVRPDREGD